MQIEAIAPQSFYVTVNGELASGRLSADAAEVVAATQRRTYRKAVVELVDAAWTESWVS